MKDQYIHIEAYLDNKMSDSERNEFEIQLNRDASLKTSLEEIRLLRNDLAWLHATNDVASASRMRLEYQRKRLIRLASIIGLIAVIFVGFFIWRSNQVSSTTQQPTTPMLQVPPTLNSVPQEVNKSGIDSFQKATPIEIKTRPIAGNFQKEGTFDRDVYRDLPKEAVPAKNKQFFDQQMKGFVPVVEPKGLWEPAVTALIKGQAATAYRLLKKMPLALSSNDTTQYLQAVAALQMSRPSAAETLLYPLSGNKKWETEAQYLLIWVYLLEGNTDLARASLRVLPKEFKDKEAIGAFLTKD